MPAEWAPHQATWLSFPHNEESWPGKLDAAQQAYAKMIASLAESETVHLNVNDAEMETHARKLLDAAGAGGEIVFHHFPTNDAWCRDHGAIFLVGRDSARGKSGRAAPSGSPIETPHAAETPHQTDASFAASGVAANNRVALDWRYNAWGEKYPPFDLDNEIPRQMAEHLAVERIAIDMVLEGGSIDVDGQGLLLTTESCLLNPNRNPLLSKPQIEGRLRQMLGVEKILWLGDGIVGDDTDGHIDDITRFVAPGKIVTAVEENPEDENYQPLADNLALLQEMTDVQGRPLKIETLPMPSAVYCEGQRLPASYANFYIANRVVLMPSYRCDADDQAADVLARCFPGRRIVGVDCADLVWGLGACHCLTQQIPAGDLS